MSQIHAKIIFFTWCLLHVVLLSTHAQPLKAKDASQNPLETAASSLSSETTSLTAHRQNAVPMIHSDMFNLIMPDYYDHHPAESMKLQNFEKFYDPLMVGNMEYKMDETQFVKHAPMRAPQPLSADEIRIREKLEVVDERKVKKNLQKLKKGTARPNGAGYQQSQQFDYDLYSVNPGDNKKYLQV